MIGRTVQHYRIMERLGGGGMGVVFKAEDVRLGRQVALKFLPPQASDNLDAKERFFREARAASKLDHPNICTIYDVGESEEGQLYLAMACYEGESLRQRLLRGPLSIRETLGVVRQIAAGLARSHASDILHRDITPANVFLVNNGDQTDTGLGPPVKILDFGLAKIIGEAGLSMSGLTQGTPGYMAPERLMGREADPRIDLWSLGVIFYECLAGVRPFRGKNVPEVIQAVHSEEPEPLSDYRADVPSDVARIVRRLLKKNPKARYGSCTELIEDLDKVGERFSARPPRGRSFWKRFRLLFLSLAVVLAGVAFILSGLLEAPGLPPKTTVAVLLFDNLSGDPELDWMSTGLTELLVNDLSQADELVVLSTREIQEIVDQAVADDGEAVRKVDRVLAGSIFKAGDTLRLTIQIQEPGSGRLIDTKLVEGPGREDLFSMIDDLSLGVRQRLTVHEPGPADPDLDVAEITSGSVEAWRFYSQAMRHHYDYEEDEAAVLLARATELDPGFSMAWAKLAAVHLNLGHMGEAMTAVNRAYEGLDRLTPHERAYVESLYYVDDVTHWGESLEAARQGLELDPGRGSLRHNLMLYLTHLELYDEALEHGQVLIRDKYPYGTAYAAVAEVYSALGRHQEAAELLQSAASDKNHLFHTALGWLYRRWGRLDEAVASFERAEKIRPGERQVLNGLCSAYLLQGDWAAAEGIVLRQGALQDSAQKVDALRCAILLDLHRGQSRKALETARQAVAMPGLPPNRKALFRLFAARILVEYDDPEGALAEAARAAEEARGSFLHGEALFEAALAADAAGQTTTAWRLAGDLDAFADKVPGRTEHRRHHHLLGALALRRGDTSSALTELEAAASQLPPFGVTSGPHRAAHAPIWFRLAQAYEKVGRRQDAINVLERLTGSFEERLSFPILYGRSLQRLVRLYTEIGNPAAAEACGAQLRALWPNGDLDA